MKTPEICHFGTLEALALGAYDKLARQVADGTATIDPAAARAILAAAGKSFADLRAAVELIRRRQDWAAELARGRAAEQQLPQVEQLQRVADQELAAAAERHRQATAALEARRQAIKQAAAAADAADLQLPRTASPKLCQRWKALDPRRWEIAARETAAREKAGH